jgi:hypothetical protein
VVIPHTEPIALRAVNERPVSFRMNLMRGGLAGEAIITPADVVNPSVPRDMDLFHPVVLAGTADGASRPRSLLPGAYWYSGPGVTRARVTVPAGGGYFLAEPATANGSVSGSLQCDGVPVADANVWLIPDGPLSPIDIEHVRVGCLVVTGPSGEFAFAGVSAGRWRVVVASGGMHTRVIPIDVTADAVALGDVALTASSGAIRVAWSGPMPSSGARCDLTDADGRFIARVLLNRDGIATFAPVQCDGQSDPLAYRVQITGAGIQATERGTGAGRITLGAGS